MNIKSFLYKVLRISNDINAFSKGKSGRRMGRRLTGHMSGKGIGKLFK